jgi:hypothetical protein
MSAQIIHSYRWTDKPVRLVQTLYAVGIATLVILLMVRFNAKFKAHPHVHAFTQPKSSATDAQVEKEMENTGVVHNPLARQASAEHASGRAAATIQERPLFDGMLVTLEVQLEQSLSSASGDSSVEATVIAALPGENSAEILDGIAGSKLSGTFQSNFDTKRMAIQFQELRTPDGRSYAVAGVAFTADDQSLGVLADYASGTGLRLLGAGLGTVINTAQQVETARVLQNETAQDGFATQELNQALSQTGNQAGASISDAATHELKNTKAVLSLMAGTRFQVKLRAVNGASR